MKRLLTILAMLLLAAGFSFESFAVETFDASAAGEYAVSEEINEAESAVSEEAPSLFSSSPVPSSPPRRISCTANSASATFTGNRSPAS